MAGALAPMLFVATGLLLGPQLPAHAADACPPHRGGLPDAERKYHPGHYVSIGRAHLRQGVDTALGDAVRGIQLRYRWADLEAQQDQYDFSAIERDLATVARANLQLVVVIEDKSFQDDSPLVDGRAVRVRARPPAPQLHLLAVPHEERAAGFARLERRARGDRATPDVVMTTRNSRSTDL